MYGSRAVQQKYPKITRANHGDIMIVLFRNPTSAVFDSNPNDQRRSDRKIAVGIIVAK
jgi:hypothetical protein